MLLFLYKVSDRRWVSWYEALITRCFRMPSPWENTVFKRTGKTRLRTRFSHCYNPCSQFLSISVQRNPAVIIMWSTIFTLRKHFRFVYNSCLSKFWSHFLEMYCQSSFLAHDSESVAVWCMYWGPLITSIWFKFDLSNSRANQSSDILYNFWSMKRTAGQWYQHQFHFGKTHKSILFCMMSSWRFCVTYETSCRNLSSRLTSQLQPRFWPSSGNFM